MSPEAQSSPSPKTTKAYWQAAAAAALPREERVRERNAAITARYAEWYRASPRLLKWAGAAAFASHRVGLALLPYDLVLKDGEPVSAKATDPAHDHPRLLEDLDLIRQTNNLVFADIGWAHAAYLDTDGGIAAIEAALAGDREHEMMLEGFRAIERGRRLLAGTPREQRQAAALIWGGNLLLLKHEQYVTVQAQFAKLDSAFRLFLTLTTTMDFDADHLAIDWATRTAFVPCMWTRGLGTLIRTRSLPNIVDVRHRWFWVERRILKIWRRVEEHDPRLARRMEILAAVPRPFPSK